MVMGLMKRLFEVDMRKPNKVPTYGLHKSTGQARCQLNGKTLYLGKYDSIESNILHKEICAKIIAGEPFEPLLIEKKPAESKVVSHLNEEISELKKKIAELESEIESMILCSYVEIKERNR
jgi:hypothetical protein